MASAPSLHGGHVDSFSYPVKGRVKPPSIRHAAHLAERHRGCSLGGGRALWEVSS